MHYLYCTDIVKASWLDRQNAARYRGMGGVRAPRKLVPSCKRLPRPRGGVGRTAGRAARAAGAYC